MSMILSATSMAVMPSVSMILAEVSTAHASMVLWILSMDGILQEGECCALVSAAILSRDSRNVLLRGTSPLSNALLHLVGGHLQVDANEIALEVPLPEETEIDEDRVVSMGEKVTVVLDEHPPRHLYAPLQDEDLIRVRCRPQSRHLVVPLEEGHDHLVLEREKRHFVSAPPLVCEISLLPVIS